MATLPSGTVTFLFTDIEDSTALWEWDRMALAMTSRRLRPQERVAVVLVSRYGQYLPSTVTNSVLPIRSASRALDIRPPGTTVSAPIYLSRVCRHT